MKTLLPPLMALLFVIPAFGQVPDPNAPSKIEDPAIVAAHDLAKKFIQAAFSGDYSEAEAMMNPDSPSRGSKTKKEFREDRIRTISEIVVKRNEMGTTRTWDKIVGDKFRTKPGRPPTEKYSTLTMWCSYPDGKTSANRVDIIQVDGKMWVELFGY